jgi:hypothetical protein
VPPAVTLKVAVCPGATDALAGCVAIAGAEGPEPEVETVRVAAILVMVPSELLTITSNRVPLSAEVVTGVR